MDSIKNRLEILFSLWNTKSIALGDSKFFVKDGIMNNEDSWFNQKRRIAFLLKDQPQKNEAPIKNGKNKAGQAPALFIVRFKVLWL